MLWSKFIKSGFSAESNMCIYMIPGAFHNMKKSITLTHSLRIPVLVIAVFLLCSLLTYGEDEPQSAPTFVNRLLVNTDALTFAFDLKDIVTGSLTLESTSNHPGVNVLVPDGNRFARLDFTDEDGASLGSILIEIFEGRGGAAAERFINLSTKGYDLEGNEIPGAQPFYSNVDVHRIVDLTGIGGLIVQTGDAQFGNGTGGSPLGDFDDQFDRQNGLNFNFPGVIAMANSGPNTNDSQFFITDGAVGHLNGVHMIFGQVMFGQNTIDKMASWPETTGSIWMNTHPP